MKQNRARRVAFYLAWVCLIICFINLAHWVFFPLTDTGFFSFQSILKPKAALSFIIISVCLLLNGKGTQFTGLIRILALTVMAFGLFTLSEYAFGYESPLDKLVLASNGDTKINILFVRMALLTSFNFSVLGFSIFWLSLNRKFFPIQMCCLTAWMLSLFSLVGYIEGASQFSIGGDQTQMTFQATLLFLIIVPAILMSYPQQGFVAKLLSSDISGAIARRLVPLAIILPLFLAFLRLLGEHEGWFNASFGTSLYSISLILTFLGLIWWAIKNIEEAEDQRVTAENALNQSGSFIKDYEKRVNKIMDVLLKYTMMDFSEKLPISDKGDEIDAIAVALNTLNEEIQTKNLVLKKNENRINEIMEALLMYTMMDFSKQIRLSEENDEWDAVALGLNTLAEEFSAAKEREESRRRELEIITEEVSKKNEILSVISEVTQILQGQKRVDILATDLITKVCELFNASVGAIYVSEKENELTFSGGYAYAGPGFKIIPFGKTLIGQVAQQGKPITLRDVPEDHLRVASSFIETKPNVIYIFPFLFEGEVLGVIELGLLKDISSLQKESLDLITTNIGVAFNSALSREKLEDLYQQTHQLAEELESQQEELRQTNEELQRQTERLQTSEEELKVQQEELQQANEELEEKSNSLSEKNEALTEAQTALIQKAEEISQANRYKSEFLANMSHELRTPLNSVLILAKLLSDNKLQNLNEKQIEYARIIHKSGTDLLNLINDILDLSKIEARKVELEIAPVALCSIRDDLTALFEELAASKKIKFKIKLEEDCENLVLNTDRIKLEQILKNLLSNAFKFTDEDGKVSLTLKKTENGILFAVSDTGIGIPEEKLPLIFEAFKQADGSTSRKFGGTGLGLSISKELTHLLGGTLKVESTVGKGSTFSILLPISLNEGKLSMSEGSVSQIFDEISKADPVKREEPGVEGLRTLLIIEDDLNFANILCDYAKEKNYNVVLAHQGDIGLKYAKLYQPDAIILDIQLPVMDGWAVLKKLKEDEQLKKIPIHLMSGVDKGKKGLEKGAVSFIQKPITQQQLDKAFQDIALNLNTSVKNVLIIEDNAEHNLSIAELIKSQTKDAVCYSAYTGKKALEILKTQLIDCIILDLSLNDISGYDLLEKIKSNPQTASIPVIVNTGRSLSEEEERKLKKHEAIVVIKTSGSQKRLLDETTLFLTKLDEVVQKEGRKKVPPQLNDVLKDKTVLLADDDMRNVFSLMAALEQQGLKVLAASDGIETLEVLKTNHVDLVLMDIMMPRMDGYEAIKAIRAQTEFRKLPIIALTAKAMKGDREKCIEVGASDYISKPVSIDQLLSLMRAWLYK